ncbi:hypothetical protein HII36_35460 [Nonomuraea sp. NN258]|uniref:RICIN domain-containing protein n=1 Tax=Nonomuraea antri TaxID=2730852 RepID=UPI001568562B|nr:hypothetical protein [Nonomuraea antri]NRQ37097.1 hypothetical protein [Nonomuraea antri]
MHHKLPKTSAAATLLTSAMIATMTALPSHAAAPTTRAASALAPADGVYKPRHLNTGGSFQPWGGGTGEGADVDMIATYVGQTWNIRRVTYRNNQPAYQFENLHASGKCLQAKSPLTAPTSGNDTAIHTCDRSASAQLWLLPAASAALPGAVNIVSVVYPRRALAPLNPKIDHTDLKLKERANSPSRDFAWYLVPQS